MKGAAELASTKTGFQKNSSAELARSSEADDIEAGLSSSAFEATLTEKHQAAYGSGDYPLAEAYAYLLMEASPTVGWPPPGRHSLPGDPSSLEAEYAAKEACGACGLADER